MIFTVFTIAFLVATIMSKSFADDLAAVFLHSWTAWLVLALTVQAVISALFLPRLFSGQTTVITPGNLVMLEVPLAPTMGNISQTSYFCLGTFAFFAFAILLLRGQNVALVRRGYFVWITLHAAFGVLDIGAKWLGLGDVFLPLRTVGYSLLTEVEAVGFWRIVGLQPEASVFGAASVAFLAFCVSYWSLTGSRFAAILAAVLLLLVALSTSSTAYFGLTAVVIYILLATFVAALKSRLDKRHLVFLVVAWVLLTASLALHAYDDRFTQPFIKLLEETVLNKSTSASGQERGYWNYLGIQGFLDTAGLGIGLGSSRTSSWPISVISQLGLIGGVLFAGLLLQLVRGGHVSRLAGKVSEIDVLAASASASVLAGLVSSVVAGSGADPGIPFFMALAVLTAARLQSASAEGRITRAKRATDSDAVRPSVPMKAGPRFRHNPARPGGRF